MTLPIAPLLPRVLDAARASPVVVSAPTGSGKSTCIPDALTALGRVLVVEPRRVACRALAARVAELRGCSPGTDVGWIVRDERRVADDAAITFVTPGVALRLYQTGDLAGFDALVLDEFHERAFDVDLLLALLLADRRDRATAQALVVMSATLDGARLAQHLGGPHLQGEGRTFPITVRYHPAGAHGPTRRDLEARVAAALESCADAPGDVLVFLPGKAEIARTRDALAARFASRYDLATLHGGMDLAAQSEVLRPSRRQRPRVVLATNVAETSLTIPGVGVVIDSGLARGMVYRAGRGYLSLLPIARDAAEQRAGRAGRLGPGLCVRLWNPKAALDDITPPELHRGSLTALTLAALACSPRGVDLPWLDAPRPYAVEAALRELEALDCVRAGAITDTGRRLFALPLDVGLARLLQEGAEHPELAEPTLLLAAALSVGRPLFRRPSAADLSPYGGAAAPADPDDLRAPGCDAQALIEAVRRGDPGRDALDPKALGEARDAARRFRKLGFGAPDRAGLPLPRRDLAALLLKVWPEAAQIRRDQKRGRFTWASGGTELELAAESAVRPSETEALIALDTRAIATDGPGSGLLITAAMPVPTAWLAAAGLGEDRLEAPRLERGVLTATITRVYAGRVLSTREERPKGEAAREAIADLILAGRCMKGAHKTLRERHDLAGLAHQVAAHDPRGGGPVGSIERLLPLRDWLLQRLGDLGLESGEDLSLLSPEDLMPPLPPPDVLTLIERHYPKTLNTGDARYRIAYRLDEGLAVFHQEGGSRKEPPSAMHLPRLPGLRLHWEHKNRVLPIPGRG